MPEEIENPLKPCPFCGSHEIDIDEDTSGVYVCCDDCFCRGPSAFVGCRNGSDEIDLEGEAIRDWNERNTRNG